MTICATCQSDYGPDDEACPQCHPALSAVNAELRTIDDLVLRAQGIDRATLLKRWGDLLDTRWRLLPATDLYTIRH